MLKRLVLIIALLSVFAALPAAALDFTQKQMYGQGIVALPMGDFGNIANLGIGAGVGLLVPHTPELSFRGEISYVYYTTEDFGDADVSASQIPVIALGQYNLTDSRAYLLGGLGLVFSKASVDYGSLYPDYGGSDTSSDLGLVLGGGYQMKPNLNLEGRLNLVSNANSFTVNVVYWF